MCDLADDFGRALCGAVRMWANSSELRAMSTEVGLDSISCPPDSANSTELGWARPNVSRIRRNLSGFRSNAIETDCTGVVVRLVANFGTRPRKDGIPSIVTF